jgi:uncharacterized protein (DUF736 family)
MNHMSKTKRIGAAWKRTTPDGKPFLSVSITNPIGPDFRYTIWPVDEKRGENSPDYTVTAPADDRPQTTRTAAPATGDAFPGSGAQAPHWAAPAEEIPADDVPF